MEVHPPDHPIHTWRDFLIHIATIVVGLLIAIGLEQTVELVHHRIELRDLHARLHEEDDNNKGILTHFTEIFRKQTTQLATNLRVLEYLQSHPASHQQDLPGTIVWSSGFVPMRIAVLSEALNGPMASLLSQTEADELHDTLNVYTQINTDINIFFDKQGEVTAYQFASPDVTLLTPQQVTDLVHGTELTMDNLYTTGLWVAAACRDAKVSPCLTRDEVVAFRKPTHN